VRPTAQTAHASCGDADGAPAIAEALGARSIVLAGMPGAGKTSIGRRLAARLALAFRDADAEIELAAGMTIPDIFATHGEAAFRDGEQKVIARLLHDGPQVLATGGGALIRADTRANIAAHGVSVWLKADLDVLLARVRRRSNRPLLNGGDPRATLEALLAAREPFFAACDLTVLSGEGPHEVVVEEIIERLAAHLFGNEGAPGARKGPCAGDAGDQRNRTANDLR
jgi:shikimate kinase